MRSASRQQEEPSLPEGRGKLAITLTWRYPEVGGFSPLNDLANWVRSGLLRNPIEAEFAEQGEPMTGRAWYYRDKSDRDNSFLYEGCRSSDRSGEDWRSEAAG